MTGELVSEDEARRSTRVQQLLRERYTHRASSGSPDIPRVIVQFWHESGGVPPDVAECFDSWSPLIARGFRRQVFDDQTALEFIAAQMSATHAHAFARCRHPAMRSDYFRLCYLLLRGGFYVDADEWYLGGDCDDLFHDACLKVQPLCYDRCSNAMVPATEFLCEERPSSEWTFYVNNNPLVAPRGHPVIRAALERATRRLLQPKLATDVQSTTGPGNLTASLVMHSMDRSATDPPDFRFLTEWDSVSISKWPLSYRNDDRNWRLWNPQDQKSPHASPSIISLLRSDL
jgi:mannosyltransferase OCH1-like enzyme